VNPVEQTLLLVTSAIILAGTLVVFVWRWFRDRDRGDR
jgi:hypothetical protein